MALLASSLKVGDFICLYGGEEIDVQDDGPSEVYYDWKKPCVVFELTDELIKLRLLNNLNSIRDFKRVWSRNSSDDSFTETTKLDAYMMTKQEGHEFIQCIRNDFPRIIERLMDRLEEAKLAQAAYNRAADELLKSQPDKKE